MATIWKLIFSFIILPDLENTNFPYTCTGQNSENVVVTRPLLGHTLVIDSYLLITEPSSLCPNCQVPLTVLDIML